MLKRGIVVTPPIAEAFDESSQPQFFTIPGKESDYWDTELRRLVTYWDRICLVHHPVTRGGGMPGFLAGGLQTNFRHSELDSLDHGTVFVYHPADPPISAGPEVPPALLQGLVSNIGPETPRFMLEAQLTAASELGSEVGGLWTIGQTVDLLVPNGSDANRVSALEIKLAGTLPVPSREVPIERVLEFKRQRKDLYLEFRSAFEHDFLDAYNAEAQASSLARAGERFRILLGHLASEMEAFDAKPSFLSMTGLVSGLAATVGTMGGAATLNPDLPLLHLAAGAAGAFSAIYATDRYRPPQLSDKVKDYAYVGFVERELLGST